MQLNCRIGLLQYRKLCRLGISRFRPLTVFLNAYLTWCKTRTRGIFCKKGYFFGNMDLQHILIAEIMGLSEGNYKNLFILKIAAQNDVISESNFGLIKFFHRTWSIEEPFNHKELDYLSCKTFMVSWVNLSEYVGRTCRRLQPKKYFSNYT